MHYETRVVSGRKEFVVQWTNVKYMYSETKNSFQVVLYEDGSVGVNYLDVTSRTYSKGQRTFAGIESEDENYGVQYDRVSSAPGKIEKVSVVYSNATEVPKPKDIEQTCGDGVEKAIALLEEAVSILRMAV